MRADPAGDKDRHLSGFGRTGSASHCDLENAGCVRGNRSEIETLDHPTVLGEAPILVVEPASHLVLGVAMPNTGVALDGHDWLAGFEDIVVGAEETADSHLQLEFISR